MHRDEMVYSVLLVIQAGKGSPRHGLICLVSSIDWAPLRAERRLRSGETDLCPAVGWLVRTGNRGKRFPPE